MQLPLRNIIVFCRKLKKRIPIWRIIDAVCIFYIYFERKLFFKNEKKYIKNTSKMIKIKAKIIINTYQELAIVGRDNIGEYVFGYEKYPNLMIFLDFEIILYAKI